MMSSPICVDPRCVLCRAVSDAECSSSPRLENTRLALSPSFIVMPCIGPFVPGHVIVVSRAHRPSFASLGESTLLEYERLLEDCGGNKHYKNALEAEHGSCNAHKAGACVVHAHMHWLPGLGHTETVFGNTETIATIKSWHELSRFLGHPYIAIRGTSRTIRVIRAVGLPSQFIRRLLCDELGRDDKDWRQATRRNWVEESIRMWQQSVGD